MWMLRNLVEEEKANLAHTKKERTMKGFKQYVKET